MSDSPIFIVGMPRSGTSLLTNMMAAHPDIAVAYETHYLNIWMRLYSHLDVTKPHERELFIDVFERGGQLSRLGVEKEKLSETLDQMEQVRHQDIFECLLRLHAMHKGKRRFGEKTPSHERYIHTLLEWYPDAKIIHTVRDPRAVVSSMLISPYQTSSPYSDAKRWSESFANMTRYFKDPRVHFVKFEDLVTDPKPQLEKICSFVEEKFDEQMLNKEHYGFPDPAMFPQHNRGQKHLRKHENTVKGSLQPKNAEKWKTNLTESQIAIIEAIAKEGMQHWGYEPVTEGRTPMHIVHYFASRTLSRIKHTQMLARLTAPHLPLICSSRAAKVLKRVS